MTADKSGFLHRLIEKSENKQNVCFSPLSAFCFFFM